MEIVILDRYLMIAEGLRSLLSRFGGINRVHVMKDYKTGLYFVEQHKPDLLILHPSGFDDGIISRIDRLQNRPRILAITEVENYEQLNSSLGSNIDGYVSIESDFKKLAIAIRSVILKGTYTDKAFDNYRIASNEDSKLEDLMTREVEVLRLVAMGMQNKEISDSLYISDKTVKNHVYSIFRKIKVGNRTEASRIAVLNHLI